MKRLKLFFACLLMAVLSIGQVWAASPATLSFSAACGGSGTDSDGNSWTISSDGSESTFDNTKGIHYGTGSAQVQYIRLSTSGISGTITQVVVNASTASGVTATVSVTVGGSAFGGDAQNLSSTATEYTFTGSASGDILVEITKQSKATKAIYCKSVVVTYTSGGVVAVESVSLDEDAISLTIDGVEQQTLTATVSPDNATNKNVTWESDDESVATVANGVVTAVGAGDATITCKSVADETKYAECAVHVNASLYTKSTLIFEDEYKDAGAIADDDAEWTVTSDGAESVYDATCGIHYGTGSANVTYLQLATSDIVGSVAKVVVNARDAQATATISVTVGGTAFTCSEGATATNTSTNYTFTGTGSGEIVVRVDRGSSMSKAIYVKSIVVSYIPSASVKKPTFSVEGGSYLGAQEVEITCATAEANIFYTLDGNDPTSESTPYNGAINISETKTLKAIAIKDEVLSPIASATYTIWDEPLSVADAIALIPNNNDQVNDQFVEGYVCTAAPSLLADGKLTYYISADGSETNRLQIYKGKNLDNTEFSAVGDLTVGDKVVVFGQLKNYSGTKEMNDGNYIVQRTAKGALQSVVVSGTPTKTVYANNEAFEPAGLVVTATYASGYAVDVTSEINAEDWAFDPETITASGNVEVMVTYGGETSEIYQVAVTKASKTLVSIAVDEDQFEQWQGLELPKPTVTATYSEGDPEDVTAQAEFTGYDASTTGDQEITVTYTFGGHDETANYTVTVNPIFNVELAASVARNLIVNVVGNTESTDDMIVRGKVSYINNASSNAQTYWISDDGTRTNEVEIYKGKYLSGADFTSANQLRVGDEVVVIGKVINYNNSTPEFANGKSEVQSHVRTPNFAITDVSALEVGATDLAVADLTINVEGEGAVTFASSDNTDAVTIVDGKLHAVAAGTATITANLAANGIYKAATAEFNVTVIPATVKYAITFDGNGADGGTAPTAIPDKAAGAEVTLPANSYTKTGYTFTGWKVYDENEDEVTVTANAFEMPASPVTIKAQWAEIPVWAYTYTSNVTLSTEGGTSASAAKVKFYGEEGDGYDAIKAGTGSAQGAVVVNVPAGATALHFHAYGWTSESVGLTVTAPTGVTVSPATEISINSNSGIANNSPFTLAEGSDPKTDAYYAVSLSGNTEATNITISATSGKRFVLFGVNQEGGVVPVLQSLAVSGDLENKTYEAGAAINPAGLTVMGTYTLGGTPQTPVDVTDQVEEWLYDALQVGDESVTISAKIGTVTSAGYEISGLTVTNPIPTISTTPATLNFGSVEQGESVDPKTVTVTLKNVEAATVALGGTNPEAYSIDVEELNGNGTVTVSVVSTASAGSYPAKLIITDNAEEAEQKEVNISLTVNPAETSVSTSSKWVAATEINDGMRVLIVGVDGDDAYAMGGQNSNNRAAVAGSLKDGVFTPGEGTKSFVLEDQGDGTYAIKTSTDKYLYAASSGSNHLKTQANVDNNAKWTLSISSAVAEGSTNRNVMQFNKPSNIFSCYASASQSPIALYVSANDYYAKINSCNAEWKGMTAVGDGTYRLNDVVYGGKGVFYSADADDANAIEKTEIMYMDGPTAKAVAAYDTVNLVLNPANGTIWAEMIGKDTVVTYTVASNSLALCDLGWAATHPHKYTDMAKQDDGTYLWTKGGEEVLLPAGTIYFKVIKSRDYDNGYWPATEEGLAYNIEQSGIYTIEVSFDPCTKEISIDTTLVKTVNVQDLYIQGLGEAKTLVKDGDNYKALATISLTAGTHSFSLVDGNSNKLGNGQAFTRENNSFHGIVAGEGADMTINVDKAGEYLFTYIFEYEQLLVSYPANVPDVKIAPLSGKFRINAKGDTAVFSRGNLQYNYEADEWYTAEKQYEVLGDLNLRFGDASYQGSIDLFGWSCESSDYGKQWKYRDDEFTGDFVDWGHLFDGGDKEWSTLSEVQWNYILGRKKNGNGHKLWTMITLGPDSLNGLALFPDDWTAPACASEMVYGFYDLDDAENYKKNAFTFAEWAEMEAAGAVFFPLSGARAGFWGNTWSGTAETDLSNPLSNGYDWVDNENWMGYYWLSTVKSETQVSTAILPGWHNNEWREPTIWARERRRGQPVRLINFIPRQYTVTYTAGGAEGNVPVDAQTYLDGAQVTLASSNGLSKEGYAFAGWKFKGATYKAGVHYTINNVLYNENIVFEAQWNEVSDYVLVTKAEQLKEGDQIIIAAAGDYDFAMGAQNGNIRNRVKITKSEDMKRICLVETPVVFELGIVDNNFTLYKAGEGYLCATSSENDYVGTQAVLDNNGKWTISVSTVAGVVKASVVAQGDQTRNTLQYNNADTRFACYASENMQPIALYKVPRPIVVPENGSMNASDIATNTSVTVSDGATLTIDEEKELDNLIVEAGGKVSGANNLEVKDLTINAMGGYSETDGKSGQIVETGMNVTGDLYLELKLCDGDLDATKYYCISAPFDVNMNGGFFWGDGTQMVFNTHFQMFEYDGEKRANTGNGWKRVSGIMKANTSYFIVFDSNNTNQNTIRLKAMDKTISNPTSIDLGTSYSSSIDDKHSNWHGVANPTFHYIGLNQVAQIFDYVAQGFNPYTSESSSSDPEVNADYGFVVGTPIFVKSDAASLDIEGAGSHLRAPQRASERYNYCVRISKEGATRFDNQLYVVASDHASATYEEGKDVLTMNGETSNYGALIWTKNYGMRLAVEEAPMVNDKATYELGIFAPSTGTYTISVAAPKENATLYLTKNGRIFWNLTMGACELDLNQGQNNEYGLILRAEAPAISTGVDEINAKAGVQKVIIDEHVFILRGEQLFDMTGKMVK